MVATIEEQQAPVIEGKTRSMPAARFNELLDNTQKYLAQAECELLEKAYTYAAQVNEGQFLPSGEPFILHSLGVSYILSSMRLDVHTLLAGLLHNVFNDGVADESEVATLFGKQAANIVRGATRIANVQFNSKLHYQAENVRKMFLAMALDIRVLLVKLADRLDYMRGLYFSPPEKQQEIAQETLDLYAPLASRLGIAWIKQELEDLSFQYLYPNEFADLSKKIKSSIQERITYVEEVRELLSQKLTENNLAECRIQGRPKRLYSIFRKILAQNISIEKVYDKIAFRLIFKTVKECYEALGLVHSLWRAVPERFKDFISHPKANLYQSLHTTVIGPHGEFVEIQIRTEEMDRIAEEGIAAHWAYKEKKAITSKDANLFKWLKQMVQWQKELKDPKEFLDSLKNELFEPEVYVLTPNGEVKGLPRGSTPIDFAYGIHTEVGNKCVGAKVHGRMVPLRYCLQNGDQVEIISSPHQHPRKDWLKIVKTTRARARIRQWINLEEQKRVLELGREICERELRKHNLSLKKLVGTAQFNEILKAFSVDSPENLLRRIGSGRITLHEIIKKLQPEITEAELPIDTLTPSKPSQRGTRTGDGITIQGVNDLLIKISRCCMPVPGDEVMGFITMGRGISVHKVTCPNLLLSDPFRRVEVNWSAPANSVHRAQIQIIAQNTKGVLAAVTNAISARDANISAVEAHARKDDTAVIRMVVEIGSIHHLRLILSSIGQVEGVLDVRRD